MFLAGQQPLPLPHGANTPLTYEGTLETGKWLSVVDASANSNQPCHGPSASQAFDNRHSGPLQATGGSKTVTLPQATLLDPAKTFAICFARQDGTAADPTWADSGIRAVIKKVSSIVRVLKNRQTGQTTSESPPHFAGNTGMSLPPSSSTLQVSLRYEGGLPQGKWLALVDASMNPSEPCSPQIATTAYDPRHSGPARAADHLKIVEIDTSGLQPNTLFAVCYAEGPGTTADTTWTDSAIRVVIDDTISAILYAGVKYQIGGTHCFTTRDAADLMYVCFLQDNSRFPFHMVRTHL